MMKDDTSSLESGESPSSNEEGCSLNNSITSFLHRLRHMPEQKKQQLVSNSVAIVRNTGTPKSNGNCASVECPQRESVPLTADEVFEVVYGVREVDKNSQKNGNERGVQKIENDRSTQKVENERSVQRNENERAPFKMEKLERTEKPGMVFVVDAHERRVRIVSREEMRKQSSRLILLEDLPEEELSRFGSIFADDIESSDRFVHCDICDQYFDFCCLEHPLYQCQDRDPAVSAQNSPSKEGDDRASLTLPGFLYIHNSPIPNAGKGVFAKVDIPVGIVFGPYEGILFQDPKKASQDGYSWELRVGNGKPSFYIDAKDPRYSNWMRYINSPRHESEQNLLAFQYRGSVFYRVYRPVDKNSELLVWYGKSFGKELGIINATSKKKPFVFYPGKNPFVL